MTEVVAGIRELVAVVSEGEGYSGGEPDNAERSALAVSTDVKMTHIPM
ncbi:hypothetical protein [Enterobacter sp. PTB]